MKVEDAACSDQKIYSQTVPHAQSAQNVYIVACQAGASSIAEVNYKSTTLYTNEPFLIFVLFYYKAVGTEISYTVL